MRSYGGYLLYPHGYSLHPLHIALFCGVWNGWARRSRGHPNLVRVQLGITGTRVWRLETLGRAHSKGFPFCPESTGAGHRVPGIVWEGEDYCWEEGCLLIKGRGVTTAPPTAE